ncbi:hypothetical protein AB0383_20155 [Amycolatopsis sp. NPDC051373]|uniref:hypothetical protein n=1 Tax=Amycolatopsis sp. NPDC051373 TaxID=3155801 RepID=UPI00344CCFDD
MTTVERDIPPSLEFPPPMCPMCGEGTHAEADSYVCDRCQCGWSRDGDFESWSDIDAAQCDATVRPWEKNSWISMDESFKHEEFRCLLDKGHENNEWSVKHAHPRVNGTLWAKGWR